MVDRFQEYTLFTYRDSIYLKKQDLISLIEQDFFIQTFTSIFEKGAENGVFRTQQPEFVGNLLTIMDHTWALKCYNLKKYSLYLLLNINSFLGK